MSKKKEPRREFNNGKGIVTFRYGKDPRDCTHCSKWLNKTEKRKYGGLCQKCYENMPKRIKP